MFILKGYNVINCSKEFGADILDTQFCATRFRKLEIYCVSRRAALRELEKLCVFWKPISPRILHEKSHNFYQFLKNYYNVYIFISAEKIKLVLLLIVLRFRYTLFDHVQEIISHYLNHAAAPKDNYISAEKRKKTTLRLTLRYHDLDIFSLTHTTTKGTWQACK